MGDRGIRLTMRDRRVRPTLTTLERNQTFALMAGGDKEKMLLMKKKKKEFDYLTSNVLMEQQKHLLAALHYNAVYNRLLFVPSIGITLGSGILAVIAQSGLYSQYTQSLCTILIAILATVSVFWQSLMKQLDYGGKASLHDSVAQSLGHINKTAMMRAREHQMTELEEHLSGGPTDLEHVEDGAPETEESEGEPANPAEVRAADLQDHTILSKNFEHALQGCHSLVPVKITAAFDALQSRIDVCNKKLVPSGVPKAKISWEKVYPALYGQLTLTIIGSKWWPYLPPDADWAVNKTIQDFREQDACLMEHFVDRAREIDKHYNSLEARKTVAEKRWSGSTAPSVRWSESVAAATETLEETRWSVSSATSVTATSKDATTEMPELGLGMPELTEGSPLLSA